MIKGTMSRYLLPFQKAKTFIASIAYLKESSSFVIQDYI